MILAASHKKGLITHLWSIKFALDPAIFNLIYLPFLTQFTVLTEP